METAALGILLALLVVVMTVSEKKGKAMDSTEQIASRCQCPDCGDQSRLTVRWNGKADEVICHRCGRTDGFKRRKSVTQIWRENPDAVPIEVANKLADKHRGEIEAVAEGLPPELAEVVREKYLGQPSTREEN